jgi:hyaluronoglucosaminidase
MSHGIIEGFYGRPWGFAKRKALLPFYKAFQYQFYIYAPKADVFLRERWQEPMPEPLSRQLADFGKLLRAENISWGIGLTPFNVHQNFDQKAKDQLKQKIERLQKLEINWLALLFDDMKGDFPDLAKTQIEICHFVKANFSFDKLLMCPSYYSFDPILEKVFGIMPENYLQDLGEGLDGDIEIFWTGEKVCSRNYSEAHLQNVAALLKRKPFIWDNYPVNDGARMSPFLHLDAVEGREHCHANYVAGLAVNPMNEAFLSQIPLATLADCLASPQQYQSPQSFRKYAQQFMGRAAPNLINDAVLFQKHGLHALSEEKRQALQQQYSELGDSHNQACIQELLEYLQGFYLSDVSDVVPTQLLYE